MGKRLDFEASITDVKSYNPLFSTCKVRVLYTGRNRNMSIITRESVDRALPSIYNVPIVGEFSIEAKDYKGHGGKIDLDEYKYVHTTKPYGVVPESATFEWETVKGANGQTREYLVIHGCYLWTGRYEEAYSVVEKGKGQSMEIEVTDGRWIDKEEAYQIDDFVFSALCILGDDVEPAFEEANITAYSLDKDSFKKDFAQLLDELKYSLNNNKEVVNVTLQELLAKYSITVEELESAGIVVEGLEGEDLENTISEFAKKKDKEDDKEKNKDADKGNKEDDKTDKTDEGDDKSDDKEDDKEPSDDKKKEEDKKKKQKQKGKFENEEDQADYDELLTSYQTLQESYQGLESEVAKLQAFKKAVEYGQHEQKVSEVIEGLGLTDEDEGVTEIKENAHEFTLEQVEEKCYGILGRKAYSNKKNFSKEKDSKNIHLKVDNTKDEKLETHSRYGDLFKK